MKRIGILGRGGFSRELKSHILNKQNINIDIISDDIKYLDNNIKNLNSINTNNYNFILAVGDPNTRKYVYNKYKNLNYINYIHEPKNILDTQSVFINKGSVICCGSILTTNIQLGIFNHINLNTTIGHDCILGDFVTCSPGVNISGNCIIGNNVSIGTNTAIREKISICDNVIIGMNSNVIKDINEPGIYIGNPIKKLK